MLARTQYVSDHDFTDLHKSGSQRPGFVAAAAAARERELASAAKDAKCVPPLAFHRPRPPALSARPADMSVWANQGAGRAMEHEDAHAENEPQPPTTPLVKPSRVKGKPSLLETVIRRNIARRGDAASQSSAATATVPRSEALASNGRSEGDHGYDSASEGQKVPPSPSLASSEVRRRIAAVRNQFNQAVAERRLPRAPVFDSSEDDNENLKDNYEARNGSDRQSGTPSPTRSPEKRQCSPRLASKPETRSRGSPKANTQKLPSSGDADPFVISPVVAVETRKSSPVLSSKDRLQSDYQPVDSFMATQPFLGYASSFAGLPDQSGRGRPSSCWGSYDAQGYGDLADSDDDDSDFIPEEDSDYEVEEEFEGMGYLPLYEFDCLPEHLRESPDIMTGYRIGYTTTQCLRSIAAWHNDSVGIWTLFGSAIFFCYLAFRNLNFPGAEVYDYPSDFNALIDRTDRHVIAAYCALVAASYLFSATYYVFRPHKNAHVHDRLCLLDYHSFFVWTFALCFSVIHFSAYCDGNLRHKLILATASITAVGLWIPWTGTFYSKFFRRLHCYYHPMIIAPAVLMTLQALYYMGYDMAVAVFGDFWAPLVGVCAYVFGNWCYGSRIPESLFPYKFDHFLNSQQIWYWCLTTSAYCAYRTLQQFAAVRATNICPEA